MNDTNKRINKTLQIKPEEMLTALDAVPVNIIITDIEGTILWCNETTYKTTGYTQKELVGNNPRILKCDDNPPEIYKEMWHTIKTLQKPWNGILRNKKKNNEIYQEELQIVPVFNENKKINKFIGIQKDVTELSQLRKKQKIKEAIQNTQKITQQQLQKNENI